MKERKFELEVINGTGSDDYLAGAVVEIEYSLDKDFFKEWTGYEVADSKSPKTTLTMPPNDVTVTGVVKQAKLTIAVDPGSMGTTDPPPGTYNVDIGSAQTIKVTTNDTKYGFAFWAASGNEENRKPGFNLKKSTTTLTIWGDTIFTAYLSDKEIAEKFQSMKIDKKDGAINKVGIKASLNTDNEAARTDRTAEFDPEKVKLTIGSYTFNCNSENGSWKTNGKEETGFIYSYKSNKDSIYGKIKLVINYKKGTWQFSASKINIPGGEIGDLSEIGIVLTIGDDIYSSVENMNQNIAWQFNGKKDEAPTELTNLNGTAFKEFSLAEAKVIGKYDSAKEKRNSIKMSKGKIQLPKGVTFNPTNVSVTIDDLVIILPELTKHPKKELYTYKGLLDSEETVKVKFDLEKNFKWDISLKNCDSSKIDPDNGIKFILKTGDYIGGHPCKFLKFPISCILYPVSCVKQTLLGVLQLLLSDFPIYCIMI